MKNEQFKTFLFSYFHNDAWWVLEIPAENKEDAEARVKKLPLARYDGELMAKIPAHPGAGLWVRVVCWWRNRRQS